MKSMFLTLLVTFAFGVLVPANAQNKDTTKQQISVRFGKQKKALRSKLIVKFVSVIEDSRCPVGVNCVWAGNAKIKVTIKEGSDPAETFELNTNTGVKGATCGRYVIYLTSLTPHPKADAQTTQNSYTATFEIGIINR